MVYMAGCHLQGTPLHPSEKKGGGRWGLIDVEAKCRALLITRMWTQSQREGSSSAEWQHHWRLPMYRANPPHVQRIPKTLEYLHIYALEMAYIDPPKQSETPGAFRQRLYARELWWITGPEICASRFSTR